MPRQNSWPMAAMAKNAPQKSTTVAGEEPIGTTVNAAIAMSAAAPTGTAKLRRALARVARRQGITGPIPESRTRTSASGTV